MTQDNVRQVSKSALHFLSGTFLSRLSGMLRDVSMAFCFGTHPAVAAFMVAFRFANLFRRLFGEGALPSSFIPHFEEARAESTEKGSQFFRDIFFSMSTFLVILILIVEIILELCLKTKIFNPGNNEIILLTMLMLPGVLFICLFGLSSAVLQCDKKFFLSGFAPAAFNLVWVAAVLFFKDKAPEEAMKDLALAVIAAFCVQWFFTMRGHWGVLFTEAKVKIFSPEMRRIIRPLFLSMIGVGAVQINSAMDGLFARFASLEGPAYLWYAIRLEQVPLALFGIALSSALLPPLSRALQAQDNARYHELLKFGLRRSFSLMMPCTLGILSVGAATVNLIYGRGDFSQEATAETVICLWGYGLGLVPAVFVLLLAPAFYAQKDFTTPMRASLFSVALNIALNALFVCVFDWGAFSIAIATSLSAFANFWWLTRKREPLFDLPLLKSFGKISLASLLAAALTLAAGSLLFQDPSWSLISGETLVAFNRHFTSQLLQCGVLGLLFIGSFLACAWLFKLEDVLHLIRVGVKPKNTI